jgi:hypothetical protein
MPRSKSATAVEETAAQTPEGQPAAEAAVSTPPQAAAQTAENAEPGPAQPSTAVEAPPKGKGASYTIDNRLGYRKEDSPDGRKRQIRFADRAGGQRPDDEMLAPVREQRPAVSWSSKDKAWQARKNADGFEALDSADQKLAELGRKRTGGPER